MIAAAPRFGDLATVKRLRKRHKATERESLISGISGQRVWAKSIERRNAIVEEHLEWAVSKARKTAGKLPTWFLPEDLLGSVHIALIQLADEWQADQSIPFRAFASTRITGACWDAARRGEYRERGYESLNAPLQSRRASGEAATGERIDRLESQERSPERTAILSTDAGRLWRYINQLPEKYNTVLRLLYRDGLTGAEAARELGCGEPNISLLRTEALAMLRKRIERDQADRESLEDRSWAVKHYRGKGLIGWDKRLAEAFASAAQEALFAC